MKKFISNHWNSIVCCWMLIVSFLFWRELFFPKLAIIATPEFSGIESIDFGYATKYFYGNTLKNLQLPVWSPNFGMGFPVLGEGQTGIFYLPNIILFYLLPIPIAYNFSIVLCSILASLGFYAFFRSNSINKILSLLLATSFGCSAYFYFQAAHIPLIQGFCLLPWLFYAIDTYLKKSTILHLILYAVLLSQQIFTGALQVVFISCSFVLFYAVVNIKKADIASKGIPIGLMTLFGMLLSAVQLIPSIEFLSEIPNSGSLPLNSTLQFSFPLKHVLTYLYPFIFGSPKDGSYNWYAMSSGSNFWENVGYFGFIPILLLIIGLFYNKILRNKNIWILLGFSFLLMLGSQSPIYFLFHLWPFSLFRVPSRYIFVCSFFLLYLCATHTQAILTSIKKPIISFIIYGALIINIGILCSVFNKYHRLLPADQVKVLPNSMQYITQNDRYYSYQNQEIWGNTFIEKGWSDESVIRRFESFATANRNILYNRKNHSFRAGRQLVKNTYIDNEINTLFSYDDSSTAAKLLQIQGVNKLLSGFDLTPSTNIVITATISSSPKINLYTITHPAPDFYITGHTPYTAYTVEQALSILKNADFKTGIHTVISNKTKESISDFQSSSYVYVPKISKVGMTKFIVDIQSSRSPGILVSTNTWYPGWNAKINGVKTKIFPININQIGMVVPPGVSQIVLEYKPYSLYIGLVLSIIGILGITLYIIFYRKIY